MTENTKIEWADHTFNPWIGCTRVGPGCGLPVGPEEPAGAGCYAEALASRWNMGADWGAGCARKRTSEANWKQPMKWQRAADRFFKQHHRRQRVFCASLADVMDKEVDPVWRWDLGRLILATPDLDWLLLTKRIGNAAAMLAAMFPEGVPPNVWLGATVTTQAEANRDVWKLLTTPAAKRFLSIEPQLGPVDLEHVDLGSSVLLNALTGTGVDELGERGGYPPLDWVLVGGESGGAASRPLLPEWVRSLRDQCAAAGVPYLFKQWGEWLPRDQLAGTTLRKTHFAEGEVREVLGVAFLRAGKKWSGRKLDGVEYTETPAHGQ
jgi:protein gp37